MKSKNEKEFWEIVASIMNGSFNSVTAVIGFDIIDSNGQREYSMYTTRHDAGQNHDYVVEYEDSNYSASQAKEIVINELSLYCVNLDVDTKNADS